MNEDLPTQHDTARNPALAVVLGVASLAYGLLIHHGVGATGTAPIVHWWQPRGWFFTWESFDSLLADPTLATVVFALPALLLFLAAVWLTRSAVASTVTLSVFGAVLIFCFYGLGGERRGVWGFFGWRGSIVMALFSLTIASTLVSPFLARSWLRLGWALRLLVYVPIGVAVLIAIRDVTGTDPSLPFAISPWPVIPMFGLEIGALAIALALVLLAIVLGVVSLVREKQIGVAARATALGAVLVATPILAGQALVARDYEVTRNEQAKTITSALDAYYARESMYPDSLEELVEKKDLTAIPTPAVGFEVFETPRFLYQSFGTNYMLEFSAPRWVQCAYNPPYPEDEGSSSLGSLDDASADGEEPIAASDGEGEPGSWSCPQKPPELW